MNRPIKFRVWHKGKNQWVHPPGIEPNILGEIILLGEFCRVPLAELNDLEVLQFTGLKDSAGQEIYEGDILSYPEGDWESGECGHDDRLEIIWDAGHSKFGANFYSKYGGEGYTGRTEHLSDFNRATKVIGNIWENPELLERNSP